jgi:hypothetical protein
MLNTVMALWNQHPGENRQRVVKLLFTFLFISVSIFLLLFTLNSSAWSTVTGNEQIQTKKEGPVRISNHSEMATAADTPASYAVVAGITPAATRTSVQACVHTPTVVVQPSVAPQKVYARNSDVEHKSSKLRQMRPIAVHVRKDKQHLRKRPRVNVIATPAPQEIIIVMPSPSPVPTTAQPTATPVVTASVTETPVPIEGTVVSSMPDIVIIDATPDTSMTSTNSFAYNLRQKGAMGIPVSPVAKSTKKQSQRVYENVECSSSTTHKDDSGGTVLKAKRRVGLLLGSSLLGILLFCCFVFARRREE